MSTPMTSRTIPVIAQWALEGKQPDGEDYRILACSTGDLDKASFADALSRFQLGELSSLPQVSVSYARLGMQPGVSYLALAIAQGAAVILQALVTPLVQIAIVLIYFDLRVRREALDLFQLAQRVAAAQPA